MPRPPSPQEARVLQFCRAEVARGHGFPSRAVIARHMGWGSASAASIVLRKLATKGELVQIPEHFAGVDDYALPDGKY